MALPLYFRLLVLSTVFLKSRCDTSDSSRDEEEQDEEIEKIKEVMTEKIGSLETQAEVFGIAIQQIKRMLSRQLEDRQEFGAVCEFSSCATILVKTVRTLPNDCSDHLRQGRNTTGIYPIFLEGASCQSVHVLCDMQTDGGGWTVFQRRDYQRGYEQNFTRYWTAYKEGFGDLTTEFWLGNQVLHDLTKGEPMILRVDLGDWDDKKKFARYEEFKVGPETDNYRLNVGGYSGDAGDSLSKHDKVGFSTQDRDNDNKAHDECAAGVKGGWWYTDCGDSRLNGIHHAKGKGHGEEENGIMWHTFNDDAKYSLKFSEMKIRPKGVNPVS